MKKYTLLVLTFLGALGMGAQESQERLTDAHSSNYRDWAINLGFGNSFLGGDLISWDLNGPNGETGDFNFGPSGTIGITKYFSTAFGGRLNVGAGIMKGDRGTELPRFETFFINIHPQLVINLSSLALQGKVQDRKWAHLVLLGGGFTANKPDYYDINGQVTELRGSDADENWNNSAIATADYNLKYRLSKSFDIDLDVGVRYYFADNIDGFGASGVGGGAAGGRASDVGVYTGLGVSYNFGNKEGKDKNEKVAAIYGNPLDDIYGDMEKIREDYDKLTSDDDGDGVSNLMDQDNSTPEDVAVDGSGKAMDIDEDGIPDYLDEDPFTPKGAKVDSEGRAVDSDGDGVPDHMDEEANTPEGTLVNFRGVKIPTDQGVGSASMPSVFFNFNSAKVTGANEYRLANIAQVLKANSDLKVKLVGYTDSRGPEDYNKSLGKRRAEEVSKRLQQVYGIAGSRISTESGGESNSLAQDLYKVNRRVEVIPQ